MNYTTVVALLCSLTFFSGLGIASITSTRHRPLEYGVMGYMLAVDALGWNLLSSGEPKHVFSKVILVSCCLVLTWVAIEIARVSRDITGETRDAR